METQAGQDGGHRSESATRGQQKKWLVAGVLVIVGLVAGALVLDRTSLDRDENRARSNEDPVSSPNR